jgi:acetyl esterase/lipase
MMRIWKKHALHFTAFLPLVFVVTWQTTCAAEPLRDRILERRIADNGEMDLTDIFGDPSTGGNTCAEKDEAIRTLMSGSHGAHMWGQEADLENISYGSHASETLDVFYPSQTRGNTLAPIIFMVHGGGCVSATRICGA